MPKKPAGKLRFQFRYAPWKEVIDWFAEQAGLSLLIPETYPTGSFNYVDSRDYTPSEAIDLINSILQYKQYTLVIKERMLMVVNLADTRVISDFAREVPVEELEHLARPNL